MYQTRRTFVKADLKMADIILENPLQWLVLEHFNVKEPLHELTVKQYCIQSQINPELFIVLSNIYNGFYKDILNQIVIADIPEIINFLRRSHSYYKNEKYPEISQLIGQLKAINQSPEIAMVEQYFNQYFTEVIEHLDYEDQVAFPYFEALFYRHQNKNNMVPELKFSVREYTEHHTDIQTKLNELKNLLLKYVTIQNDLVIRRKLILNLFEVEYDLNAHSMIESHMLSPLVNQMERA